MSHSVLEQPLAILIVAPVGAYLKRVQSGIRMIISSALRWPKKTEVHIYLVVDSNWVKEDPKYMKKFVKPLLKEYDKVRWTKEFSKYDCEPIYLDPENENENTLWLLEKLLSFFKEGSNRKAYIDLTSAPREWVYSAFYVSNFIYDADFYFVKSGRKKSPSEYTKEEINDEGKLSEYVLRGQLTPPLSRWLEPHDEKGKENIQYEIFKLMYEIALEKGKDISKLPELTISVEELAERASTNLTYYRKKDLEDVEKGISRHLTDIDRNNLFKRTPAGKTMVVSRKAIVIMQVLFGR